MTCKRVIAVVWMLFMITSSLSMVTVSVGPTSTAESTIAGGNGTITDPHVIMNIWDLQNMSADLDGHYILGNDIDASATSTWNSEAGFEPVGDGTSHFNGTLDGRGFAIYGLTINRSTTDHVGLFGYLSGTSFISNLSVRECNITGRDAVGGMVGVNEGNVVLCYSSGTVNGSHMVGILVGHQLGTIEKCHSNGRALGVQHVGGFMGLGKSGSVTGCYSTASVTGSFDRNGGFAGGNYAGITNCYATGDVIGPFAAAGLVGMNYASGIIRNCYATGLTVSTNYMAGGLVASNYYGRIENCYATGSVIGGEGAAGGLVGVNDGTILDSHSTGTCSGTEYSIGGFIGVNKGTVTNCYSTGSAFGTGPMNAGSIPGANYVGGFTGQNSDSGTISYCYSTGSASTTGMYVGGFVGSFTTGGLISDCYSMGNAIAQKWVGGFSGIFSSGTISRCYSIGAVSGDQHVGGFNGGGAGTDTNCFWDIGASGASTSSGGSGNTTAEMKRQATFTNWDFTGPWGILENTTYPYLTTMALIVTTPEVTTSGTIREGETFVMDLYTKAQPHPFFDRIEDWYLSPGTADWLSIGPNGRLAGVPTNDDIGPCHANVTVTDTLGSVGYYNISLNVVNSGPVILTRDITLTAAGAPYRVDYVSSDDPNTTWSLTGNASWLTMDSNGVLSGTPGVAQTGSYDLVVTVDDGHGGRANRSFTLTVAVDHDGDRDPDVTDPDDDNDGTPDSSDAFPFDPSEDTDTDGDGTGNNADTDDDDDGWSDTVELVVGTDPLGNTSVPSDLDGDGTADPLDEDMDGDGVDNIPDAFPANASEWADTDHDGTGDNSDLFPEDLDNDGVPDVNDSFPSDPTRWEPPVVNNTVYVNRTTWINRTITEYHNRTIYRNTTINAKTSTTDTDDDGMPDWWEECYGLDINDPSDASYDQDKDNATNLQEFNARTSPLTDDSVHLSGEDSRDGNGEKDAWAVNNLSFVLIVVTILVLIIIGVLVYMVSGKSKVGTDEE